MDIVVTFSGSREVVKRARTWRGLAKIARKFRGWLRVTIDVDGLEIHDGTLPDLSAAKWQEIYDGALEMELTDH